MKKVVMLSAVTMLSLAGIAVSQAEDKASAPAAASATASASSTATASAPASSAAPAKKEAEKAPEDPPQVAKLVALYPNLIARIAPQGKVCFEGKECDITIAAALGAADPNKPREGKVIYEGVCHTCHTAGLLGAPKLGDKGAWSARIGKGTATLHQHAIQGFNAMPAKGGNADLLDVEVTNAVDYMVSQAK
ncbi:cytochrome c5 family protein [Moraxella osloensis]|jgi:cytochrome c5|uniref:Cytochrome c5 family protein n=1 Tax=Faucicola osloensis TaxID=34062 RepID=A0A6P1KKY7_FAUOS|nr:c-type cytochrome [Moraxella osloensis]QHG08974.1 cytochrome c5 family protein [Moraxella osloensis]